MLTVLGVRLTVDVVVLGALRGLTVGLLAVGIVLVFRASRVVNLAHAQVGTLCAAGLGRLVVDAGVPYAVALPLALLAGGALGLGIEGLVVRRLADAPRVVLLVATIGVSQLLVVVQSALPAPRNRTAIFPSPLRVEVDLPHSRLGSAELMVLLVAPAVVAGLATFLARSPTGLAIRASASNPDAAELAGISRRRTSSLVWAIAGALSALSAVLTLPLDKAVVGTLDAGLLGPGLLLAALTAALLGGLGSLPLALAGGLGVGVLTALEQFNGLTPGAVVLTQFGLVFALVGGRALLPLLRGERRGDDDETVTLTRGRLPAPVPAVLAGTWWAPRLGRLSCVAGFALAAGVPLLVHDAGVLGLASRVALFGLLGLSLTVLTGWAGQLSLGQVAFYGLAAAVTARLVGNGVPFPAAVGLAVVLGIAAALALGAPALVVRGLLLGVVTLAFALAVQQWLLQQPFFTDLSLRRPAVLRGSGTYYLLCLTVLAAAATAVGHLRRTGAGRRIIAARANPARAASLTVATTPARLLAFGLSGALCGLAGGLFAGLDQQVAARQFPVLDSLVVVAVVAVGGFGSVPGTLLGAAFVLGVPAAYSDSLTSIYLVAGLGLLLVLLYLPGGLVSLVYAARDAALDVVATRRVGPTAALAVPAPRSARAPLAVPAPRSERARVAGVVAVPAVIRASAAFSAPPALVAAGIAVSFGGRRALRGVDLEARPGEVLGLIGSNGAGKSTLLGVLSGFLTPSGGSVTLGGRDVTGAPPHQRAALGLGRVFQDARLFGDLTVTETLQVALEARERSELLPCLLALPPSRVAERRKRVEADEVLGLLGLGRYADLPVSRLSTGTRRVVELGCLVAQQARVLLLDEPTAGLAQREAEAFVPLLLRLRDELGATVVLVEHDIPLVRAVSDRVQCLGAGVTIAVGSAAEVLRDPAVVASYLGTDDRAVARSGALPAAGARR